MPIILATWEAEIRKIMVKGQPKEEVHQIPSQWKEAGSGSVCWSLQKQWTV
jgi:hypothetical protein